MLSALHVMGSYWHEDSEEPTDLGRLVAAAKDEGDAGALEELEQRLSAYVLELDLPLAPLVVAVPPGPDRDAHPVPSLAAAVAEALDVDAVSGVVTRARPTPRLRDTPVARRRDVVESAGYSVDAMVEERAVVLVDDVVLTGTTLDYLAERLLEAGASEVTGLVIARTRLGLGAA